MNNLRLLAGLFLAALAMRPQVLGIGPMIPDIQADLSMSHSLAGMLSTIPVLCMGLFALSAMPMARKWGVRAAVGACLVLIAVSGAVRAFSPTAEGMVLLTIPIGISMGLGGVLLSVASKEFFPDRPALATGIYSLGILLGASASAGTAAPLAEEVGWRNTLIIFSVSTGAVVAIWLLLTRARQRPVSYEAPQLRAALLRDPAVASLPLLFGLQSMIYHGLGMWLPEVYVERGWSQHDAGFLVAALNIVSIVGAVAFTSLGDRLWSRKQYLIAASGTLLLGVGGFVLHPVLAWVWVSVAGFGAGLIFPLVLTLPLDVSHHPQRVAAVAGITLTGGYALASTSPVILGVLRDATGSFSAGLWFLGAVSVALFAASVEVPKDRWGSGVRAG